MNHDFNSTFPTEEVKKEGIKYGIYLGVISLIIFIATTYIIKHTDDFKITQAICAVVNFILVVALSIFFSIKLRKISGGFWSFSQALKNIGLMLIVSVLISELGGVLFRIVDSEPYQVYVDKQINYTIEAFEELGLDDMIDRTVANLESTRELSVKDIMGNVILWVIIYFIFALILAAILKRERPVFLPVQNNLNQEDNERQDKPEEE